MANLAAIRSARIRSEDRQLSGEAVLTQRARTTGCAGLLRSTDDALAHSLCYNSISGENGERILGARWPGWPGWDESMQSTGRWYKTTTDGVDECESQSGSTRGNGTRSQSSSTHGTPTRGARVSSPAQRPSAHSTIQLR